MSLCVRYLAEIIEVAERLACHGQALVTAA